MKPIRNTLPEIDIQKRHTRISPALLTWWKAGAGMALLVCFWASYAAAQAMVEYGHATAAVGAATSAAQPAGKGIALTADQAVLALPPARQGETAEVANRAALAAHAGKHSAKLMLRSAPNRARVRIDGKPVGRTPLLLIIAPGVYAVEMDGGARLDFGRRRVDLLPGETREVLLPLAPRYPAQIRILWPSHDRHGQGGAQDGGI